jgi:hypothetical protein
MNALFLVVSKKEELIRSREEMKNEKPVALIESMIRTDIVLLLC